MSFVPETPTTIFDDREDFSPAEMAVPNILVLGPDPTAMGGSMTGGMGSRLNNNRWSSNSSVTESQSAHSQSAYSESSQRTATSTNTRSQATPTPQQQQDSMSQRQEPEDPHLLRLKALILKAAMNVGFGRQSPTTLTAFVRTLPSTCFGTQPWQLKLFESYRKLVLTDPTLRGDQRVSLPAGRRMSASELGRAVQWMARSDQFAWFKDLYLLVFGFSAIEAPTKKGVGIQL